MHQSAPDGHLTPGTPVSSGELYVAIDSYANRHEAAWIDVRRRLHRHPEPSGEEFQTSELIRAHLTQHSIPAQIAPRDVGVIADFEIGRPSDSSPVLAVRADIDALKMTDRKSTDYASAVEGCAHACGHDVHTTIVLATAEILAGLVAQNPGALPSARVRLVFQAAEEICKGARWMVEDGAMRDVHAVLGIHVDPQLAYGKVGICYGTLTAQVDEVAITIRGQGGHTARPHVTSDPIAAASTLISLLYQRLPRSVDVRDPSVFTVGQIHGGTASNVIPDHVEMSGSLRCVNPDVRRQLLQEIRQTCAHLATLTGNTIAVDFRNPLGAVRNSKPVAVAFDHAARSALGDDSVVVLTRPSMGGEDFSVYLEQAPGAQIRLGCAGGPDWPLLHSPVFDVDERVIALGARIVTRAVLLMAESAE